MKQAAQAHNSNSGGVAISVGLVPYDQDQDDANDDRPTLSFLQVSSAARDHSKWGVIAAALTTRQKAVALAGEKIEENLQVCRRKFSGRLNQCQNPGRLDRLHSELTRGVWRSSRSSCQIAYHVGMQKSHTGNLRNFKSDLEGERLKLADEQHELAGYQQNLAVAKSNIVNINGVVSSM